MKRWNQSGPRGHMKDHMQHVTWEEETLNHWVPGYIGLLNQQL